MKVSYNPTTHEWDADGTPLKELYFQARQASGRSVNGLEREMGLSGRSLYYLEHGNHVTGKPNVTLGLLVRALQHLGYEFTLS